MVCQQHQFLPFGRRNHFNRSAKEIAGFGLNFRYDNSFALLRQDIDFAEFTFQILG